MPPITTARLAATAVIALTLVSACTNSGSDEPTPSPDASQAQQVFATIDAFSSTNVDDLAAGALDGLTAIAPGGSLSPVSPTPSPSSSVSAETGERARIELQLQRLGQPFDAQTFDAVTVFALAASAAQTDDGTAVSAQIRAVTDHGTSCSTFGECAKLLANGEDINYDGVSGPLTFGSDGELQQVHGPRYQYDEKNRLPGFNAPGAPVAETDAASSGDSGSGSASPSTTSTTPSDDGQLKVAAIVPIGGTTNLAESTPPAVQLAVDHINSGGGVFGRPVVAVGPASTVPLTSTSIDGEVQSSLDAGADAVVVAAQSDESTQAVAALAAAAVPQAVTVATSDGVSGTGNSEFFRFVPDQALYAQLLAQSVQDAGASSLTVVANNEPDSKSLAKAVTKSFSDLGGEVVATHGDFLVAPDNQKQAASMARRIADLQPAAVLLVSEYGSADLAQQLMAGE
jgi:hypothetical protein